MNFEKMRKSDVSHEQPLLCLHLNICTCNENKIEESLVDFLPYQRSFPMMKSAQQFFILYSRSSYFVISYGGNQ